MKKHCEKFDADYESDTGKWLEIKCDSKNCEYCSERPDEHKPHEWEFIEGKLSWCGK